MSEQMTGPRGGGVGVGGGVCVQGEVEIQVCLSLSEPPGYCQLSPPTPPNTHNTYHPPHPPTQFSLAVVQLVRAENPKAKPFY